MPKPARVFLARAGKHGEDEEFALENGLAIIGFNEVPSLAGVADYDAVYDQVAKADPDAKPRQVGNRAGQLWAFALSMKQGDIVVLPRKLVAQVALGRVAGPYAYQKVGDEMRHTRQVEWLRPDVPRTAFEQDLLYSFGAYLTVCNISRNDAERRIAAVLAGHSDPGPSVSVDVGAGGSHEEVSVATASFPDLSQLAHDQIVAHIQARFAGHSLARLVDAVLRAEGWVTRVAPPGADGGVDILAGRGSLAGC